MDLEIFIITNGRSTYSNALRSLERQSAKIKITVVENMKWVTALNHCNSTCKTKYYLRVDDDMLLHKYCAEYMYSIGSKIKSLGAYVCRLWEDWSSRVGGTIKMYNVESVVSVGGFIANKLGKVDKPVNLSLSRNGRRIVKDCSIVGVHACGTTEDQNRYRQLWLENSKHHREAHSLEMAQKKYSLPIERQYLIIDTLYKRNRKINSGFYNFLKSK